MICFIAALLFSRGIAYPLVPTTTSSCGPVQSMRGNAATHIIVKLKACSLDEAVKAISGALPAGALVDGSPRKRVVDLDLDCPLDEALNRIATAFDYGWQRSRANVVMFTKRFADERELPQLHRSEMSQIARDSLATLRGLPFDPSLLGQPAVMALGNSLSPAQLDALQGGSELPVADLTSAQQANVGQAIYSGLANETYHSFDLLYGRLSELDRGTLRVDPHKERNPYTSEVVDRPYLLLDLTGRTGRWYGATLIQYPGFSKQPGGGK